MIAKEGVAAALPIRTHRLVLRAPADADADAITALASDREIAATTLRIPHPYTRADASAFIDFANQAMRSGSALIAFIERTDAGPNAVIGSIGLEISAEHRRAEIGYWIGKPYWGRGYATEAGRAVVRVAFAVLGLDRVCSHHFGGNVASGRVLEKIGLRPEGTQKFHVLKWGRRLDAVMYGVSAHEWLAENHGRDDDQARSGHES